MEDMEMTPMTTGASVTVSMPVRNEMTEVEQVPVTSKEIFEDPELGVEPPRDTAEMLFRSAKEEGFEEALTHLAEGDFETETAEDEVHDIAGEDTMEKPDAQEGEVEEIPEPERKELLVKIENLEEKVAHLIEKNDELSEHIVRADERAAMSQEMLIEMFKYLYEMAKKEEDEKTKLSIFEVLLAFIAKFMITIVDPDSKVEDGKKEEKVTHSSKKPESFEQMLKYLKEKGTKGFAQNMPQEQKAA